LHRSALPALGARRVRRAALVAALAVAVVALPPTSSMPADASVGPACDAAPLQPAFDDVRSSGTFTDAIRCVAGYGLVSGYSDDTFRPGAKVTRAEAATFLAGALETATGVQLPDPDGNPFSDVSRTGVHGPAILRLERAGIVAGVGGSRYGGDGSLTRGQMAAIVVRGFEHIGLGFDASDVDYDDVPDGGVFAPAISKLTNASIVRGTGDGLFEPNAPVTRGQLAQFIAKTIEATAVHATWLPTEDDPQWTTLRGSLQHLRTSIAGPRVVNIVRWRLDDTSVRLRTDYAGGATWRDDVVDAAERKKAIVAVNGGFWVNGSDPDGLLVRDRRMDSDTSVTTNGSRNIRSGFALHGHTDPVVGVPFWYGSLTLQDPNTGKSTSVRIDGVNRPPFPGDEVVVYAPGTYAQQTSAPGRYYVVDGVPNLMANGTHQLQLASGSRGLHVGGGPVQAGNDEMVIWIRADVTLAEVPDDRTPTLRVQIDPAWERARIGLVAGPWLLEDGQVTSEAQWRSEGFTGSHTDVRHPRSAIGFTDDGWGYIVTVDGRRPGASVGSTHEHVARILQQHGVTDAVMLDGGGSTQLAIRQKLANRPCCDKITRSVATVLLIQPR
jgi:hypothetical protein